MNLLYSACVVQALKWSASSISQKQGSHPVYLEFDFDKRKLSFLLMVEARTTTKGRANSKVSAKESCTAFTESLL